MLQLSKPSVSKETFGENACHPEPIRCAQGKLRDGSGSPDAQILRCAQDDSQDSGMGYQPRDRTWVATS